MVYPLERGGNPVVRPGQVSTQDEFVIFGSREPITAENRVEFHLLYNGPLHSAGYELQRSEKHSIRRSFHPQLKRLWRTTPNLYQMAVEHAYNNPHSSPDTAQSKDEIFCMGLEEIGRNRNRNGFNFIPLVTSPMCLRCSLDILFLRAEEKDYVLQGGDIDGRLKILFDALRMVPRGDELPPGTAPQDGEDPFFCLLEDDKLISEVRINTGQLLLLPHTKELDKHDVYLQITVSLNTTQPHQYGWVF
jgi:hypothetical protein